MFSNLNLKEKEGERQLKSSRIRVDPGIYHGKPCIKGTRIPVHLILELIEHGYSFTEIMEEYPAVTGDDIRACLAYAKDLVEHVVLVQSVQDQISS